MSSVYNHPPEYRREPLLPVQRQRLYEAFLEVAYISEVCDQRPNGMYVSLQHRFDTAYFFDELSERSGLDEEVARQGVTDLKILRIADFDNAYSAIINPQAVLFTNGYQEVHTKEAFRFSNTTSRQYYWDGGVGVVRETQDRQRAYDELAAEGRLNRSPTIPRTVGQYVSKYLP